MTTARELASEFLNRDASGHDSAEVRQQDNTSEDERGVLERVFILWLIHDKLPWDADERGLSVPEIRAFLARAGFQRSERTVQRDMNALMQIARVHFDAERARPRRYHRFLEQRLTDCLPDPARRVARYALDGPEWPSQIVLES